MNVVVTCEFRFYQTPDGAVWTPSAFTADFWQRYLNVFDGVKVVARIKSVTSSDPGWRRSDRDNVTFIALPYYVGLVGLAKTLPLLLKTLKKAVSHGDALIYRVPSQTATIATALGNASLRKYAVEVVGDPSDVFQSGIVNGPMDKLLGYVSSSGLRRMCKKAVAVSYVTQEYLQQRYPPSPDVYTTSYSSIELDPSWIASAPRVYDKPAKDLLIIGSFGQLYKGQDTLLKAIAVLKNAGTRLTLTLLGGGRYLPEMQKLAESLGIAEQTNFMGEVNSDQVKQCLQKAELFVMPSRTEGLPRALIEAMATGLPAIGSRVGGIPELLDPLHLFEAENVEQLASRLGRLSQSIEELNHQSELNISVAKEYQKPILEARRTAFYQAVKQCFEATK